MSCSKDVTRATLVAKLSNLEDQESWMRFFDRYYSLIKGSALKVGSHFNEQDAEDVTQETILAVVKQINNFKYNRKKGSFRGWLASIVRNKAKDRIKKNSRKNEIKFDERHDLPSDHEIIGDDEWVKCVRQNAQKEILQQISVRDFQIFDTYVTQGASKSEVCDEFGISGANLDQIKSRVGKKWREQLEKESLGVF